LDVGTYEEVEADSTALGQAMVVVVLSSVAAGIGSGEGRLITGAIGALVVWFVWAFLTFVIGTKILPQTQTRSDVGELLRTIGFASAPGILRVFGFVPVAGSLVLLVASVWMLAAMVVAVRQALDFTSTWRAVGVCIVGWVVVVISTLFLAGVFGIGAGLFS
jgi:hypothetical protein